MRFMIQPRTLSGFRDFLPDSMMVREWLIETARHVYRSFGFAPIDTPALEYYEILAGKGSEETDRQMYQFHDHGQRHVGMRFDLTVPLARYCAQHIQELGTPFKRYHIATVWRGERAQAGRYREFMQCDFDTIGTTSVNSDIETALVIHDLMAAIGFERFQIRVNNRKVLNGILEKTGLTECSVQVLRAIDKLEKVGVEKVAAELRELAGASDRQISRILELIEPQPDNRQTLARLAELAANNALAEQGVDELQAMLTAVRSLAISDERFKIDVAIARGLDYYTGTVFETMLPDLPNYGSVCSGGRYDNLAELYTKQQLPGIGASLGLDRLLACMEKLEMLPSAQSPAQVLVTLFDQKYLSEYLVLAAALRRAGFATEVYPEPRKIGQQFKYADRKGFEFALVAGENEFTENCVQIKNMRNGDQTRIDYNGDAAELITFLTENIKP